MTFGEKVLTLANSRGSRVRGYGITYLAIDTVFYPSGIIQNGTGKISSKSHV